MVSTAKLKKGGIRIRLLPSQAGGNADLQFANTFLINDTVAVDAGSLGFQASVETQSAVREILLTHAHADHIASLPMFLINGYRPSADPVRVWASADTHGTLSKHVFNDKVWPDLDRIGTPQAPFVHWGHLRCGEAVVLEGLRFTPVAVDHTVPTFAFLVESADVSIVIGGDTAPTTRLWQKARELGNLRGVFLESSFANDEQQLADASMHLRPETFEGEVHKMPKGTPFFAVHFKPGRSEEIKRELLALELPSLEIVEPGREYVF